MIYTFFITIKGNGKNKVNKYAIYFAATGPLAGRNYLADVNCLLNSIEKHRLHEKINGELDVHLIHYGFDPDWKYIEAAKSVFSFNIIDHELSNETDHKAIEYIKRIRYLIMLRTAHDYNAVCLLDSDMFFVSDEIINLFEIVNGTDKLIGCNEKYKWDVGPLMYFTKVGEPIFFFDSKLHSMICNVPSIFDLNKWEKTFGYYHQIAFDGYQLKNGNKVGIGDLFAHNIAIHKTGRTKDVVMFPMETMAQVHHTWINPNTYIVKDDYGWRSAAGDKIYMIHDTKRICRINFVDDNIDKYRNECGLIKPEKFEGKIRKGLEAVQHEWFQLNYDQKLFLDKFIQLDDTFYKE